MPYFVVVACSRGLYHLCNLSHQLYKWWDKPFVAIFCGSLWIVCDYPFSDGGRHRPPCSNRGDI
nr:MAG TPA: hypothetical protein [Caudoviricetes sp.]